MDLNRFNQGRKQGKPMAYDTDTDALIDRLIDRVVEAEKRNAAASYIQAMQQYELMKAEHADVSRILANLKKSQSDNLPKLNELWDAANQIATFFTDSRTKGQPLTAESEIVTKLRAALEKSYVACDVIPF